MLKTHRSRLIYAALLAGFALLTAVGPSPAQETLKPGDVISGRLRYVQTQHPNGTPINAFQIVIGSRRDFAVKDEFCNGTPKTFHLVVMDDKEKAARLARQIGKKIFVIGEEFFCSQTAWHIGDAVVTKWQFEEPFAR